MRCCEGDIEKEWLSGVITRVPRNPALSLLGKEVLKRIVIMRKVVSGIKTLVALAEIRELLVDKLGEI